MLCQALAAMAVPDAVAAIATLEPWLATWDDELRATMCGMTWDDQFFAGQPDPRSSIVRYLRFDRYFAGRYDHRSRRRGGAITAPAIRALVSSPDTRYLTRINLSHQLDEACVLELAAAQHFTALKFLQLDGAQIEHRTTLGALASAPFYHQLEKLSLYGCDLAGSQVDALFLPARPKRISLSGNPLGPEGAREIAAAIGTRPIALELRNCGLGDEGAKALAAASLELAELALDDNGLGDAGLIGLAGGTLRARSLSLARGKITSRGVAALVEAGWPLEVLTLRDNALDDDAAVLLARQATLRSLAVYDNDLTAVGLAHLIGGLESLTELEAGTNRIAGLGELSSSIDKLELLSLEHNRLGDGIRSLAAIQSESLRYLNLGSNVVDVRTFEELTGAAWFSRLESLVLSQNPLGPGAGVVFGAWTAMKSLELADTQLGDEGVEALCGAGLVVKQLDLARCQVSDAGISAIAGSSFIHVIEELDLRGNAITARGISALLAARPKCLKQLKLSGNRIDDDATAALARWEQLLYLDLEQVGPASEAALAKRPARCCP